MQAAVAKGYKFLADDPSTLAYLETKETERMVRAAEVKEAQRRRAEMESLMDEGGRLARLLDRVQLSARYEHRRAAPCWHPWKSHCAARRLLLVARAADSLAGADVSPNRPP